MVSSTGTFVSCKDYDDDIDAINKELTDLKSKLSNKVFRISKQPKITRNIQA